MKPTRFCRVFLYRNYKFVWGMDPDGMISIYYQYRAYNNSGWYSNISLTEDGAVHFRRVRRSNKLIAKLLLISNLNTKQRRIYKILQKEMTDFKNAVSKMSCDGCIYLNTYKLTNNCNKCYKKATEI